MPAAAVAGTPLPLYMTTYFVAVAALSVDVVAGATLTITTLATNTVSATGNKSRIESLTLASFVWTMRRPPRRVRRRNTSRGIPAHGPSKPPGSGSSAASASVRRGVDELRTEARLALQRRAQAREQCFQLAHHLLLFCELGRQGQTSS